jgi:type IV secretory pathway VirB2 component (pilin)
MLNLPLIQKAATAMKNFLIGRKGLLFLVVLGMVGFVLVTPAYADLGGNPWESPFWIIINALNGTTGTLLATLAVMVVGVMALMGRIAWSYAGAVLFGIACIFGAPRIVAIFHG